VDTLKFTPVDHPHHTPERSKPSSLIGFDRTRVERSNAEEDEVTPVPSLLNSMLDTGADEIRPMSLADPVRLETEPNPELALVDQLLIAELVIGGRLIVIRPELDR